MMSQGDVPPQVGRQQLDAVLQFLPVFERPDYQFGEWRYPEGRFPYYACRGEVDDFVGALFRHGMIFPFDWPSWQEEAERYYTDPHALETAGILTLRKLLITHVRKDRFAEGHLGSILERGHITAILRRLKAIREEMGER